MVPVRTYFRTVTYLPCLHTYGSTASAARNTSPNTRPHAPARPPENVLVQYTHTAESCRHTNVRSTISAIADVTVTSKMLVRSYSQTRRRPCCRRPPLLLSPLDLGGRQRVPLVRCSKVALGASVDTTASWVVCSCCRQCFPSGDTLWVAIDAAGCGLSPVRGGYGQEGWHGRGVYGVRSVSLSDGRG